MSKPDEFDINTTLGQVNVARKVLSQIQQEHNQDSQEENEFKARNQQFDPGLDHKDHVPGTPFKTDIHKKHSDLTEFIGDKLYAGKARAEHLYRAYKHSPHSPPSYLLKYLIHRINNHDKYEYGPTDQKLLDEEFEKLHQYGGAKDKNGHIKTRDLRYWALKNPDLMKQIFKLRNKLHKEIKRGVGLNVKTINNEPYVALARGIRSHIMSHEHALSSFSDMHNQSANYTGNTGKVHHTWVPLHDLWFSFDHAPNYTHSYEWGPEDEFLASHSKPRYEAKYEDVTPSRLKHLQVYRPSKQSLEHLKAKGFDQDADQRHAPVPQYKYNKEILAPAFDDSSDDQIADALNTHWVGDKENGIDPASRKHSGAYRHAMLIKAALSNKNLGPKTIAHVRHVLANGGLDMQNQIYNLAANHPGILNNDERYQMMQRTPYGTDVIRDHKIADPSYLHYIINRLPEKFGDPETINLQNHIGALAGNPRIGPEGAKMLADKLAQHIQSWPSEIKPSESKLLNNKNGALHYWKHAIEELVGNQGNRDWPEDVRAHVFNKVGKPWLNEFYSDPNALKHSTYSLAAGLKNWPTSLQHQILENPSLFEKAVTFGTQFRGKEALGKVLDKLGHLSNVYLNSYDKEPSPGFVVEGNQLAPLTMNPKFNENDWQDLIGEMKKRKTYIPGVHHLFTSTMPTSVVPDLLSMASTHPELRYANFDWHKRPELWTDPRVLDKIDYSLFHDNGSYLNSLKPQDIPERLPFMRKWLEHNVNWNNEDLKAHGITNIDDLLAKNDSGELSPPLFNPNGIGLIDEVFRGMVPEHGNFVNRFSHPHHLTDARDSFIYGLKRYRDLKRLAKEHEEQRKQHIIKPLPEDWIIKSESDNLLFAPNENIAADMLGFNPYTISAFDAARFLVGGPVLKLDQMRKALFNHEGDPDAAALEAYGIPVNDENRSALAAVKQLQDMHKFEDHVQKPKQILPGTPDAQDFADILVRAFNANEVTKANLGGKHSEGTFIATDPDSHQSYILKPGHGLSPAAGMVADNPKQQSAREAAFYHIAKLMGLEDYVPETQLVLVDDKPFAMIKMLNYEYKNLDKIYQQAPTQVLSLLHRYLKDGSIHKWAIMDYLLGNTDRHAQNIMVNKEGKIGLIDHGSAFADDHFDPGFDQNSFIPFYLRAWHKGLSQMSPEEKIQKLPRVSPEKADDLHNWLESFTGPEIKAILDRYGISAAPVLQRLDLIKLMMDPPDLAINKLWAGT